MELHPFAILMMGNTLQVVVHQKVQEELGKDHPITSLNMS
jgi:hypothetical protein